MIIVVVRVTIISVTEAKIIIKRSLTCRCSYFKLCGVVKHDELKFYKMVEQRFSTYYVRRILGSIFLSEYAQCLYLL